MDYLLDQKCNGRKCLLLKVTFKWGLIYALLGYHQSGPKVGASQKLQPTAAFQGRYES
jgi:hypothetical protein